MSKRILLADDSITIQKIVNLTFSGEGIDVVTVGNGDAAIKKAHEIHPDLILADIFMPGKNGYEVCEHIKNKPELLKIPVILLVGDFEPFDGNEASRVRADGHLTKPFEIKVLISAVNSLISASEVERPVEKADETLADLDHVSESSYPESLSAEYRLKRAEEPVVAVSGSPASSDSISVEFTEEPVANVFSEKVELSEFGIPSEGDRQEGTRPPVPVIMLEDSDPLGLYVAEASTATSPLAEVDALPDSKSFVVDIWESKSVAGSAGDMLLEVDADRQEIVQHAAPTQTEIVAAPAEEIMPELSLPVSKSVEVDSAPLAAERVFAKPAASLGRNEAPESLAFQQMPQESPQQPLLSAEPAQSELVDLIANKVVEKLSKEVIEKIAWEVIPDMAEMIIKEHLESHLKTTSRPN